MIPFRDKRPFSVSFNSLQLIQLADEDFEWIRTEYDWCWKSDLTSNDATTTPQQSFLKLFDRSKPLVVDIPLFKLNLVKTRGFNR